jgi:hypothetical protein
MMRYTLAVCVAVFWSVLQFIGFVDFIVLLLTVVDFGAHFLAKLNPLQLPGSCAIQLQHCPSGSLSGVNHAHT